ncbi:MULTISPECIES: hypothetical protein [Halorussus]|uniref:hypothetical protein n=1 Tax=Halorussus TaxID=1070314 RepID=UPI0013B46289|nr:MULTISPECIES: hypothetical protein [Halorussus]NHN58589.1 hypothetical protein [Halorussus sp. JP-T4]
MRERVSQLEVVRSWLDRERRKGEAEISLSGDEADWQLVGALFAHRPFQAAFVWRHPVTWYRTELDETAFRRLEVIEGPRDESWRELSPDGTILGAARRIRGADLRGRFEDIDVDHVRRLAGRTPESERIVCFRRGTAAPYVADGNHYATATALRLLRDGEYAPQRAYLGVRRYPSVR